MNERGAPTPVAWTRLRAPESLMGPADPAAMTAAVTGSTLHAKYVETLDRESAHELLAKRLEEGAAKAEAEERAAEAAKRGDDPGRIDYPKSSRTGRSTSRRDDGGMVEDIINSPVAKDLMRTAAREILRGVFGTGRR
jgi:hypothetical protein